MDQGETTKQEINYIGFMVYLFCQNFVSEICGDSW